MFVRSVGLVIYTYVELEEQLNLLWEWTESTQSWSGKNFTEFYYSPGEKGLKKIHKKTRKNLAKLYTRLQTERPWRQVNFGVPDGTIYYSATATKGIDVTWVSYSPVCQGSDTSRKPSYVYIIASSDNFREPGKVNEFVNLGRRAWEIVQGVYGYIDIETEISPKDNLVRDFSRFMSNLIPPHYFNEFREWQKIAPVLDKKIWKVFWGNFLGKHHLQQIGGYQELRRADYYRPAPEIKKISLDRGKQILQGKAYEEIAIAQDGIYFQLSPLPFDTEYFEMLQTNRHPLQSILEPISISTG
jgi:hypothetical protein